jgi:hypothetical protein
MAKKSKLPVLAPAPRKSAKVEAPVAVKPTAPVAAPKVTKNTAKAALKVAAVAPAQVAGATAQPRVGLVKFADTMRIELTEKGANNPRKDVAGKGTGEFDTPFKRYAAIIQVAKSKDNTVGAFVKLVGRRDTLTRAVNEGYIKIACLSAMVYVGGMLYNVPVLVA